MAVVRSMVRRPSHRWNGGHLFRNKAKFQPPVMEGGGSNNFYDDNVSSVVPWPQIHGFPAVRSHSISSRSKGWSYIGSNFPLWRSMVFQGTDGFWVHNNVGRLVF